ncbi:MAG: sigma 54-interacting transcriptional regulator [Planctomycetes bacterium]|nr:sigma 54-interacting transcriptional regulator [Planctomycetota bacterium]
MSEELKRRLEELRRLGAEIARDHGEEAAAAARGALEEGLRETPAARPQYAADEAPRERARYAGIIGDSPAVLRVLALIDRVAEANIPVLIQGESGTGKELVAQAIHENSARRTGPFVTENCAAIPETLQESELFGYKRGAFTGADRDRKGLFQTADRGTLFLDEVGDMSPAMQKKLLRVLQDGEIRPVGGATSIHVDVRLVSASNRPLLDLISRRLFREDLYFRLNGVTIELPPLRARAVDIPALCDFFLRRAAAELKVAAPALGASARDALAQCTGALRRCLRRSHVRPGHP